MNKKQKILTVVALIVFVAIIAYQAHEHSYWYRPYSVQLQVFLPDSGKLTQAGTQLLMLAVLYVGLLFVLADRRNGG